MRFDLKFFRIFSIIDIRESFILPFFTRKFSTVILSEGGYAPSRSWNDKTSTVWYLVYATLTFLLSLIVDWWRLPSFPAKMMMLVHACALLGTEKIVLVVVLILESKGLCWNSPRKQELGTVIHMNSTFPLTLRIPWNSPFSWGSLESGMHSQQR